MAKFSFSWNALMAMENPLRQLNSQLQEQIVTEQRRWRSILEPYFPEDPSERDWRNFRPLRISREEDWSNWLAYLLESSSSHMLSKTVFGSIGVPESALRPRVVEREIQAGRYRADMYIQWEAGYQTHVEIKVGDKELEKTLETGKALLAEKRGDSEKWSNCILLLEEQLPEWRAMPENDRRGVHEITWTDVAKGLRTVLANPQQESTFWISWAIALTGCIEQTLLGISPVIAENYYSKNKLRQALLQVGMPK